MHTQNEEKKNEKKTTTHKIGYIDEVCDFSV